MMLLSVSKSSPHTCWAIMGRVSTRPTFRRKYSRSAYSRAVTAMRLQPLQAVPVRQHHVEDDEVVSRRLLEELEGGEAVRRHRVGMPFLLQALPEEARDLPLVL